VDRPAAPDASRAGSVAGFGVRFLAFLIDGLLADLIGIAVTGGQTRGGAYTLASYIAFLLIELLFVGFVGQTPGMRLGGIGVLRADRQGRPAFKWVALRTLLLAFVIPAVVADKSGLAMHDRAAGTATIRTR
jgi:uncharacterized RDD family membrane protein YckC